MPALNLFHRSADRPRPTMRERVRTTVAKILPRDGQKVRHVEPAFAAIEEARRAWAAYATALDANGKRGFPACDEPGPELDAVDEAADGWFSAWNGVLETRPTTLAGCAALASFMVEGVEDQASDKVAEKALASLATSLSALAEGRGQRVPFKERAKAFATTTAQILHFSKRHNEEQSASIGGILADLDERFAYLEELFHRCCAAEDEARVNNDERGAKRAETALAHATRQQVDILGQIASLPASTPLELAHKARILSCSMGQLWDIEQESRDSPTERLERAALRALLDDVMAAGGLVRRIKADEADPAEILERGI